MVERGNVETWVAGYVRAWESNDPEDIAALFTDDACYYVAPYGEPRQGRDGIVAGWLERRDEPGDWTFRSEVIAVADDAAFVRGWTDYPERDEVFSNLWVIRFAPDGRCREFTEWWMEEGQEAEG